MRKKNKENNQQLYSMFNLLKSCTDNESDFNRIVGYSFFQALASYTLPTSNLSEEQSKFYEVKHFYNILNQNIESSIKKGSLKISNDLMVIEDTMSSFLSSEVDTGSVLLEKIINSNSFKRSEKNFSAYIESKTEKVYRLVLDKGMFKGNRNILLNDYDSLFKSFIG